MKYMIICYFAPSFGYPTPLLDASIPLSVASIEARLREPDTATLGRYLEQATGPGSHDGAAGCL